MNVCLYYSGYDSVWFLAETCTPLPSPPFWIPQCGSNSQRRLNKIGRGQNFFLLNPCSRCSHFHPYYENVVLSESSNLISYLISFYAPCRRGLVCFLLSCTSCVIHIVIHLRFHWLMSPGACVDFHSWGPIRNRVSILQPPRFSCYI